MPKKDWKKELFLKIAQPDENWVSRWVKKKEFVGEFAPLYFDNGFPWGRGSSQIRKEYIVEVHRWDTPWNRIDAIRLNWFNKNKQNFNQNIRQDIFDIITKQRCVILWTHISSDCKSAPDHKDGRKDDPRVMNTKTQLLSDFQPLSVAANNAKKQFCKECKRTWMRYDATKIWYPIPVVEWTIKYEKPLWCKGCFWFDPIEFRKHLKFTWK